MLVSEPCLPNFNYTGAVSLTFLLRQAFSGINHGQVPSGIQQFLCCHPWLGFEIQEAGNCGPDPGHHVHDLENIYPH